MDDLKVRRWTGAFGVASIILILSLVKPTPGCFDNLTRIYVRGAR
jgi:hypothetical protein